MQHYESEPEFREQVNRYVHDLEGMLRRILTDRDTSALGVTILSSDRGKLYVALAQTMSATLRRPFPDGVDQSRTIRIPHSR